MLRREGIRAGKPDDERIALAFALEGAIGLDDHRSTVDPVETHIAT